MELIENIRLKYITWSMRTYLRLTTLWYNHIMHQQKIHWDRLDPILRTRIEMRMKLEDALGRKIDW